jgi:hypothetical protein
LGWWCGFVEDVDGRVEVDEFYTALATFERRVTLQHTSRLRHARNDIIVAGKVRREIRLQPRPAVVAPQAPLVLRGRRDLPSAARPGRRARRRDIVGIDPQRRRDTVGDAQQLAMWLCNRDLCRRSRAGRRVCGGPLPRVGGAGRAERRVRYCLDRLFVVAEGQEGAALGRAARRDGGGGDGCGVAAFRREGEARSALVGDGQRGPHYVGHGAAEYHWRCGGSSCTHCDACSAIDCRVGVVKAKRDG